MNNNTRFNELINWVAFFEDGPEAIPPAIWKYLELAEFYEVCDFDLVPMPQGGTERVPVLWDADLWEKMVEFCKTIDKWPAERFTGNKQDALSIIARVMDNAAEAFNEIQERDKRDFSRRDSSSIICPGSVEWRRTQMHLAQMQRMKQIGAH